MPADGNIHHLRPLRLVESLPQSNAYGFPPVTPADPEATFKVDRRSASVLWVETGLRLREPEDFDALANLFLRNGRASAFLALGDAQMALSATGPEAA